MASDELLLAAENGALSCAVALRNPRIAQWRASARNVIDGAQ
ncbi:MAG TPA: hypothetical protein VHK90_18390 [Thermoanaerobaculia bacterium]|nr:hypothetical protein [Thermoanaerobaculia bacterium]